MSDDATPTTANPDQGEVLSIWATLQAMTEMSKLTKPKEPDRE